MDRLLGWLAKLPTTNARIAVTLILATGTAIRYWADGSWEPAWDWLAFLAVMSGLDAAQFHSKRKTHIPGNQKTDA